MTAALTASRRAYRNMELATGVEPATYGLQNRCSAIELRQHTTVYCSGVTATVPEVMGTLNQHT